jgi:hypothetical protein
MPPTRISTALTYSATGLPSDLAINSSSGVISGTLGFASAGYVQRHRDRVRRVAHRRRCIHSHRHQHQPATAFSTNFGDRTDAEGAVINFDANASDPDGTTLTYSAHRPARWHRHQQQHGCRQWHAQRDQLGQPTTRSSPSVTAR